MKTISLFQRLKAARLREEAISLTSSEDHSLELAGLEKQVGDSSRVSPLFHEMAARFPDSKAARFALARHLLLSEEGGGVSWMDAVLREDPSLLLGGSRLLRDYFEERGDPVTAKIWQDRYLDEAIRLRQAARRMRRVKNAKLI